MAYLTTQGGQPVLILKEGTSRKRGKEAQANNIMAAKVIAEVLRTTLGPRGMDKMLIDSLGDITITSDGATVLEEIDVQHPAAKMMIEVAQPQLPARVSTLRELEPTSRFMRIDSRRQFGDTVDAS